MDQAVFMFPGQGSQQHGMGEALFPRYPHLVQLANDTLGYDLPKLCASDERLHDTQYTQPALFVVNHLHLLDALEQGARPAVALGHSLGEYNALVAAGMLEFGDALRMVRERGALMARHADGGMLAVMRLDASALQAELAHHPEGALVDIANANSRQQTVIAGPSHALERLTQPLQDAGAFVVALKVSGAFHSRLMHGAANAFAPVLADTPVREGDVAVISNVTASAHNTACLRERLCEHLTHPVRWQASIERLLDEGHTAFREIGVGRTLSGLQRYIVSDWNAARSAVT